MGRYIVTVERMGAPTVCHYDYASALEEAQRLAKFPSNVGRLILVSEVKTAIKPQISYAMEHSASDYFYDFLTMEVKK